MSNHLLSVTKTKYGIGHIPIVQSVLAHCFILQTPYLLPENYFIHHRPTVMNQFNHTSELFSSLHGSLTWAAEESKSKTKE